VVIKDIENSSLINLPMEEYLIGVLAGEMPASFEEEALKAQAVASRTYAYYKILTSDKEYDLTTDITTQVYLSESKMKEKWQGDYEKYYQKIKKAIDDTKGEVLTFNDVVIPAYYFSMSNGYTESALAVFGEDRKYLVSVNSQEDVTHRNYEVTKIIEKSEFCTKLNIECNDIVITNLERNNTQRIISLDINGLSFTGIEVRKLLNLRSTDFALKVAENNVEITTKGYGHGVGMSQYGANTMAKSGFNYEQILFHYYSGVEINDVSSIK